jgi:hypothetical protein
VRDEVQRSAGGEVGQAGVGERGGEHLADSRGAQSTMFVAVAALEQQRQRW